VSPGQDAAESPAEDDDFDVLLDRGPNNPRTVKVSIRVRQNITEAVKLADTFGLDAKSTFLGIAGIYFGRIEIDVYSDT
jgi:hypothetical protein